MQEVEKAVDAVDRIALGRKARGEEYEGLWSIMGAEMTEPKGVKKAGRRMLARGCCSRGTYSGIEQSSRLGGRDEGTAREGRGSAGGPGETGDDNEDVAINGTRAEEGESLGRVRVQVQGGMQARI